LTSFRRIISSQQCDAFAHANTAERRSLVAGLDGCVKTFSERFKEGVLTRQIIEGKGVEKLATPKSAIDFAQIGLLVKNTPLPYHPRFIPSP
jgi:hypothetical protein